MRDFQGKIAVVTGAGTGIGRELARQLVLQGSHVAICDINESNLDATVELCLSENPHDVSVTACRCDVADESQVQNFLQDVQTRHSTDRRLPRHPNLLAAPVE